MINREQLYPLRYNIPTEIEGICTYSVMKNGLFATKRLPGNGKIAWKISDHNIPGLEEAREEIKFLPRKIPFSYFQTIHKFFRYVEEYFEQQTLEANVCIIYDQKLDQYRLWVPYQENLGLSCEPDYSQLNELYPGWFIVISIHSHCKIPGRFSSTDDKANNRDRFSGVIGNIDKIIPTYQFRFSANGKHWNYELEDLFIENMIQVQDFVFETEVKNIKLIQPEITQVEWVNYNKNLPVRNNMAFEKETSFIDYYLWNKKQNKEFTVSDLLEDW